MSPREEDENQLIEDVGIGNVKVMFQRGDRDVAIKLSRQLVYLLHFPVFLLSFVWGLTFCSIYSCPAAIAVFPTWNPI